MSRLYGIVLLRVEPGSGYGYNRCYCALSILFHSHCLVLALIFDARTVEHGGASTSPDPCICHVFGHYSIQNRTHLTA